MIIRWLSYMNESSYMDDDGQRPAGRCASSVRVFCVACSSMFFRPVELTQGRNKCCGCLFILYLYLLFVISNMFDLSVL